MSFDPDRPLSVFAYAYTSAVGVAVLLFGPVIIGAYVDIEGMTEMQAGYLFSLEMAGYALSSALVFTIVTRVNWRHILLAGVTIVIFSNVTSIYLHDYAELLKFRFLAGLGAGLLMNITMVSIGLTTNYDRNYGFWAVMQLTIGAAGLYLLPWLIPAHGLAAPFLTVTVLALLVLPLVNSFPAQGRVAGAAPDKISKLFLGLTGLLGIFIYYGGQAAVWAYFEAHGYGCGHSSRHCGTYSVGLPGAGYPWRGPGHLAWGQAGSSPPRCCKHDMFGNRYQFPVGHALR